MSAYPSKEKTLFSELLVFQICRPDSASDSQVWPQDTLVGVRRPGLQAGVAFMMALPLSCYAFCFFLLPLGQ